MAGVIEEDELFPVRGQWHASMCILIHLFHFSVHKAKKEKEKGREGGREGRREGGRPQKDEILQVNLNLLLGIRELSNGKIMIDVYNVSSLKTKTISGQGTTQQRAPACRLLLPVIPTQRT